MKKNNISIYIYIFVFFSLFIILGDIFTFFLGNNMFLNYFLSLLFLFPVNLYIKKRISFESFCFNKIDIIFIVILSLIFLLRVFIPDSSFDVLNYHLYVQENFFSNSISFNFFPARWINTFSFPLSDRMHYFFRLLLGYRFGMILNLLVLIIIYFQLKKIFIKLDLIKNEYIICLLSFVLLLTEQILSNSSTYYIDIISIPLFLEIIIYLIFNKCEHPSHYFTLLMAGILIAMKVSNLILIIPLAVLYIILYRESITIRTVVVGIFILILPCSIYMLNNYIQVGNPVFPFYNSIFKSPYLDFTNWSEEFYGPKSLIETIFWPIYVYFVPRRANDVEIYSGRISLGYICSILVVICFILFKIFKKRKNDELLTKTFIFSFIYIILCLTWSKFLMGYIRYALILEILAGVVIVTFCIFLYNCKINFTYFLMTLIFIVFILQCSSSFLLLIKDADTLSWRYSIVNPLWKEKYLSNFKATFNKYDDYNKYTKNISFFGIVDYNSGYASLISKNIPIINLNEGYINDYGQKEFNSIINKCDNIYTISTDFTKDRTMKYANMVGYTFSDNYISFKTDFLDYENSLLLIELKKSKKVNK